MPKSRIVITVVGGVAEIVDAENWPDGLEVYVVDYDQDGRMADEDDLSFVNGDCSIDRMDRPSRGMTGHYANQVAEAWKND